VLFGSPISELTTLKFQTAFEAYKEFAGQLGKGKLDKILQTNYALIEQTHTLIELLLYKDYKASDLVEF
jgi:hypothetical protein